MDFLKDFINRNKPVFMIAFITVIIFIVIILLSQKQPATRPELKKVENLELVSPHTYKKGATKPRVVLVEFSDLQCPACRIYHPFVSGMADKYKEDLQLAYRHFPLAQHPEARIAAIAAQAAGIQGKFWEYTDILYDNQDKLKQDDLVIYAEQIGLNVEKYKKDTESADLAGQIDEDIALAEKIGINATPTFFLNNKLMEFRSFEEMEVQIQKAIKTAGGNPNPVMEEAQLEAEKQQQSSASAVKEEKPGAPSPLATVEIKYTEYGFEPNNLKLPIGTRVKFVNTTESEISIRQLIENYSQFTYPVKIKSNEEFEFELNVPELWTFKEDSIRHYGSIFVSEE